MVGGLGISARFITFISFIHPRKLTEILTSWLCDWCESPQLILRTKYIIKKILQTLNFNVMIYYYFFIYVCIYKGYTDK